MVTLSEIWEILPVAERQGPRFLLLARAYYRTGQLSPDSQTLLPAIEVDFFHPNRPQRGLERHLVDNFSSRGYRALSEEARQQAAAWQTLPFQRQVLFLILRGLLQARGVIPHITGLYSDSLVAWGEDGEWHYDVLYLTEGLLEPAAIIPPAVVLATGLNLVPLYQNLEIHNLAFDQPNAIEDPQFDVKTQYKMRAFYRETNSTFLSPTPARVRQSWQYILTSTTYDLPAYYLLLLLELLNNTPSHLLHLRNSGVDLGVDILVQRFVAAVGALDPQTAPIALQYFQYLGNVVRSFLMTGRAEVTPVPGSLILDFEGPTIESLGFFFPLGAETAVGMGNLVRDFALQPPTHQTVIQRLVTRL